MEKEPNSRRYWRLNSLMALRETRESERDAEDPEHLAAIKANNAELAQLEERETAIKNRLASILANRKQKTDISR